MIELLGSTAEWLRGFFPTDGDALLAGSEAALSTDITQRSQTSFQAAFFFLPAARRQALNDVYAYCRLIDDIVDGPGRVEDKAAELAVWRRELTEAFHGGHPSHPIARQLQDAQRRFGLRHEDALAVLLGCELDLHKNRYQTWDEVYSYCYQVASSVGLLCIDLFGCSDARSREYAIHLGYALQLTNILRDVAEDATRDRLYLPLASLRQFGLSEADVLACAEHPPATPEKRLALGRLLSSVARKAREEYRLARESRCEPDRRALLPAEIMGQVYLSLLGEIEQRGIEVVLQRQERVSLSRRQKLSAVVRAIAGNLLPFQT